MLIQSNAAVEGEVNVVLKDLAKEKKKDREKAKEEAKAKETAMQIESEGKEEASKIEEEVAIADEDIGDEVLDDIVGLEEEADEDLEDEEDEDDEDQYNPKRKAPRYGFGGSLFGRPAYKMHQHQGEHMENATGLPEGKCSLFCAAIKKNYQGVAYLMLQSGCDFMSAIQVFFFSFYGSLICRTQCMKLSSTMSGLYSPRLKTDPFY